MKIGLLGGSFNPFHNGHLIVAQTVKKKLNLDQIWLLPTANHPFKEKNFVLPFQKRFELIKKAISNHPNLVVRDDDFTDKGFNYTDNLLQKLYRNFPEHDFYFIIGEDNVQELPKWHNFEWLLEHVKFIVVNRPNSSTIQKYDYAGEFIFLEMHPIPISSSEIRKKICQNQAIDKDVPANIRDEIYQLYQNQAKYK